ncbi:hypothetical protein D9Q98_004655 [Chlorella vulgaris]|uniref:GAF domain-containing protein n=1 Tax=Chlorella vulgaris TaxID=3077 RepID=A0A9D4TQ84_CHLVU|nr:hypothetical protein D9Q98_004655 [Chlorella vulgaris]
MNASRQFGIRPILHGSVFPKPLQDDVQSPHPTLAASQLVVEPSQPSDSALRARVASPLRVLLRTLAKLAPTRLFTRLLLCAHVFCLLLVLCGMAAVAQPDHDNQSVDEMLTELSGPGVNGDGGSPFKAFARRAQMVITGLVHISVLLLPRQLDEAGASSSSASKAAGGSSASGSTGSANAAAELAAAGFPSDGSNFEDWQQVQRVLDRTATGGVDWDTCCVYKITAEGGAAVEPEPPYPASCTAAFHAAQVKHDAVIANDYPAEGPHFADWRALHASGARSMAAAPMYVQQRVVGVLNLASKDPHAFDRSRLVWLLALVLAPFVEALKYTTQALEVTSFVQRIMPPLLEQNYRRNTLANRAAKPGAGANSAAASTTKPAAGGKAAGRRDKPPCSDGYATLAVAATATGACKAPAAPEGTGASSAASLLPNGSDQFAQNAEVLITGTKVGAAAPLPSTPATAFALPPAAPAAAAAAAVASGVQHDKALLPRSGNATTAANGGAGLPRSKVGRVGRGAGAAKAPVVANGWARAPAASNGVLAGDGGEQAKAQPQLGGERAAAAFDPASLDPYLSAYDSDLDWGDFLFNLISMTIVYAYFSEAAVAGESQAAIVVSMCIAAIDIALLALRWLWYEQYITYGGAVLQVFQMYRLIVLPVANTWMSWSLLNKLGIAPSSTVVAATGMAVLVLIVAGGVGVQTRFLLHAPLQLASVLFAASSTTEVCGRFFASNTSLGCMGAVSVMQLSLGVFVPGLMCHLLDMRGAADKPYLPHVQAKRWLLQP